LDEEQETGQYGDRQDTAYHHSPQVLRREVPRRILQVRGARRCSFIVHDEQRAFLESRKRTRIDEACGNYRLGSASGDELDAYNVDGLVGGDTPRATPRKE